MRNFHLSGVMPSLLLEGGRGITVPEYILVFKGLSISVIVNGLGGEFGDDGVAVFFEDSFEGYFWFNDVSIWSRFNKGSCFWGFEA